MQKMRVKRMIRALISIFFFHLILINSLTLMSCSNQSENIIDTEPSSVSSGAISQGKTQDILPGIDDWQKDIISDKPGETHIRYFMLTDDGIEKTLLDVYAMTEEHDLDGDGLSEIVAYLPGEKRNIGIYDLLSGQLKYIDVGKELGAAWSEYMGNMGNLQREYLNDIEVGFESGESNRYEVYYYKNGELIYLRPFDNTLIMQ